MKNFANISKIGVHNFSRVPELCRFCLYWQTTGAFGEEMLKPDMEEKKKEWFSEVAEAFGSCMKIAYYNDIPIGFIQYAQPKFFQE